MKRVSAHPTARRVSVAGLLLFASVPLVAAQSVDDAFRFTHRDPATGPRMTGLAGAGHAGVADWSALASNPAGLGWYDRSEFTFGIHRGQTRDMASSEAFGFEPRTHGMDRTEEADHVNLSYVYRAPTARGSFVVALGYGRATHFTRTLAFSGVQDQSTITTSFLPDDGEYTLSGANDLELDPLPFAAFNGGFIEYYPEFLDEDPDAYPFLEAVVPGTKFDQQGTVRETGGVQEVNFGGAFEVSKGVMVGLSFNVPYGEYEFRSVFDEIDTYGTNGPEDYSVAQDDSTFLKGFESLSYRQHLRSDLVGINARAGVSTELRPGLRLGFTVETPTAFSVEESYGAVYETHFDDGGSLRYGDLPGDLPDDVGSGVFAYELTSPWRLGAGLRYQWNWVTALADIELVAWDGVRFSADTDHEFFDRLNDAIRDGFDGVLNQRFGIEVSLGRLVARAGAAVYPDPRKASIKRSSGAFLERDRDYLSFGLGYRFGERLRLDLSWMATTYGSGYQAYPEDDLGPRQDDSLLIDEDITEERFVLGAVYRF